MGCECILAVESQYDVEVDDEVLTVKSPSSLGSRSPTSTSVQKRGYENPGHRCNPSRAVLFPYVLWRILQATVGLWYGCVESERVGEREVNRIEGRKIFISPSVHFGTMPLSRSRWYRTKVQYRGNNLALLSTTMSPSSSYCKPQHHAEIMLDSLSMYETPILREWRASLVQLWLTFDLVNKVRALGERHVVCHFVVSDCSRRRR